MARRQGFRVERLAKRMPPRIGALLDYLSRHRRDYWGGPFNGQERRQEMILEILDRVNLKAIVETGTFRGMTTEFLRRESNLPVHTAEIDPHSYHYSRLRFRRDPDVKVVLGDSRQFLSDLAADESFPEGKILFYLDAHWESALPVWEEINIISRNWLDWLIIVDDFQVPDDVGYAFDEYGGRGNLSIDNLSVERLESVQLFWPTAHSSTETGNRRGCVLIASDGEIAKTLAGMSVIRQIPSLSA